MSKITFSQAKEGYLLAAGARHLSKHTIREYVNTFKKFSKFLDDDLPLEQITRHYIESFFAFEDFLHPDVKKEIGGAVAVWP